MGTNLISMYFTYECVCVCVRACMRACVCRWVHTCVFVHIINKFSQNEDSTTEPSEMYPPTHNPITMSS